MYADLTVRKVMPAALEKHLSEQPCHFPSQMSDERRSIWVWDLPFPIQIDGRRYRCRTCAANGASMRYYVITVSDLQAAFPDLLTWRDRRHGTVFFTKKFLLYLVQVFYRRLNVRATKRAIVEQIGASALAIRLHDSPAHTVHSNSFQCLLAEDPSQRPRGLHIFGSETAPTTHQLVRGHIAQT